MKFNPLISVLAFTAVFSTAQAQSLVGNFTARALLTKESAANAEAFKRRYGFRFE
jgi:hypothetical protein